MSRTRLLEKLLPAAAEGPHFLLDNGGGDLRSATFPADPVDAQNAVQAVVMRLVQSGNPEIGLLDALISSDWQAQPVIDRLLTWYVEGHEQLRPFEWKVWEAALRLTQSLFKAYEYLLRHIRITADENWAARADLVLAQLFHHRNVEFLLRFLRYKKRSVDQWSQLHEMLGLARQRGLLTHSETTQEAAGQANRVGTAVEEEYLQILLLEAMNCGQFSPREALWAHRWFVRWCSDPGLRLKPLDANAHGQAPLFVVDPSDSEGLKRTENPVGNLLYLDVSNLSVRIEQEIASLLDSSAAAQPVTPAMRSGQLALLGKLAILFALNPVRNERRTERTPVDLAVQAIAGLPCIVELFRKNGQKQIDSISPAAVMGNGITLLSSENPIASLRSPSQGATIGPFDAIPQTWQVKDQNDFGCRMRGQVDDLSRVIPGSLIIVRDAETVPWVVSVVRWFRRLMIDHVEIGVEYLGRNPRLVKIVSGFHPDLATGNLPDPASRCFTALFLPPSNEIPNVPIKTLLLPASEFRADLDMTLLSSGATYRMRLNDPIQQQFDFVWTSFTVLDTWVTPMAQPQ